MRRPHLELPLPGFALLVFPSEDVLRLRHQVAVQVENEKKQTLEKPGDHFTALCSPRGDEPRRFQAMRASSTTCNLV